MNNEIIEKKKKELEERMHLLRLKYKRLEIMQEELISGRENKVLEETPEEKVLRRKYEKRNIGKSAW